MKKSVRLALASLMMSATACSLFSTTYAFVILTKDVEVDEFNFKIEPGNGLLVSLDNNEYSQGLKLEKIKEQIKTSTGVDYDKQKYEGVTLKMDDAGKVVIENGKPVFVKDSVKPLAVPNGEITGTHELIAANQKDYLVFDLWFKVEGSGDTGSNFNLYMSDKTTISGGNDEAVKLLNTMVTGSTTYYAGDTIIVNPVNAMRLGVLANNNFTIYEENVGLGSSAIEGSTASSHNKNTNPMYTYYNSIHPFEPLTSAAIDGKAFETKDKYTDDLLGNIAYDATKEDYEPVKITVAIWLEGWDADYFLGIPASASTLDITLGFEVKQGTASSTTE